MSSCQGIRGDSVQPAAAAATIITACCVLNNYCRVRNIKFNFALTPSSLLKWQKRQETKRCHCQQRVAAGINQDAASDSLAKGLIVRQRVVATFLNGLCMLLKLLLNLIR